ncbi:hypothetical protein [Erwinia amylovora]
MKGSNFTLSVIHLHHTDPAIVRKALEVTGLTFSAFLKNAPVVVNVAALTSLSLIHI